MVGPLEGAAANGVKKKMFSFCQWGRLRGRLPVGSRENVSVGARATRRERFPRRSVQPRQLIGRTHSTYD